MDDEIYHLAEQLGKVLLSRQLHLVTAESCTGGWLAKVITDVSGSSGWFEQGVVVYSNASKQRLLNVPAATLDTFGAVSRETAEAMVSGALSGRQDCVGVSVTGIAGPDGGTTGKPVGTVWFGWGLADGSVSSQLYRFSGDRRRVRYLAVVTALKGLMERLEKHEQV